MNPHARSRQVEGDAVCEASETAASFLLDTGLAEQWVEGAIFPSELVFFLAVCKAAGISAVVESGRQDGYSTEILGRWAQQSTLAICSIDLEEEKARAEACRQRLNMLPVSLVRGNAYSEVGRQVHALTRHRLALLMDGPKGWPALSLLMASAAQSHVRVMALHNLHEGFPERTWFQSQGGSFYEDLVRPGGPNWRELRRREIEHARRDGARRSLEISSLGVLVIDDSARRKLARCVHQAFGLHQPPLIDALWRTGAFAVTPKVFGLSARLLGR